MFQSRISLSPLPLTRVSSGGLKATERSLCSNRSYFNGGLRSSRCCLKLQNNELGERSPCGVDSGTAIAV
ncbi:hypothetical protein [Phormidesmis priestleyi]|uniref:hypothetical protein n=1 Tax=Phormidesmis priestleyi TaxID=268141 RepID=UPI0012E8D9D2|nr:hypothetical protein [Phormidesmis priestleyi]